MSYETKDVYYYLLIYITARSKWLRNYPHGTCMHKCITRSEIGFITELYISLWEMALLRKYSVTLPSVIPATRNDSITVNQFWNCFTWIWSVCTYDLRGSKPKKWKIEDVFSLISFHLDLTSVVFVLTKPISPIKVYHGAWSISGHVGLGSTLYL